MIAEGAPEEVEAPEEVTMEMRKGLKFPTMNIYDTLHGSFQATDLNAFTPQVCRARHVWFL